MTLTLVQGERVVKVLTLIMKREIKYHPALPIALCHVIGNVSGFG